MTTVSCRELAPTLGDLAGNTELVLETIAASTADVLVLPELVTSGYVFTSPDEARTCAVSAGEVQWSRAVRGDAVVIGGFAELGDDGEVYNSAAVVTADGLLAVYRKAHLWDQEKRHFRPGTTTAPVIDTVHGRIAVMICYDAEFPEYTRSVALAGADLVAVPTNWPLVPRPLGERPPEVLIAQAAARVNRVALALCDRAGTERGQEWTQGTSIVDHEGWVVAGPGGDQTAELDLTAGRSKRVAELADLHADRRTDLY